MIADRPSDYFHPEALEAYWYWINERHKIFLKRARGDLPPWTEDPILQNWKFCNVFRKNDKQSQLLTKNVILPHWNDNPALMLFNIYAFRAFNWWPTYKYLVDCVSPNKGWINKWEPDDVADLLETRTKIGGQQLTSGAYMIRGREGMPKYESIVQTLDHVWRMSRGVAHVIGQMHDMQSVNNVLMEQQFWGWGHFTTYQILLDLIESPLLEHPTDLNTWCEFGPGAIRGIRLIWPKLRSAEFLPQAIELQQNQHRRQSHVPELNLQDIEFSLCELSKYLRIKNGGKGKEGYAGY